MTLRTCRLRGLALVLACLVSAVTPSATYAQFHAPLRIPSDAVRVVCCRCIDNSVTSLNLSTRTAAWKVAMPGSSNFQPVVPVNAFAWASLVPALWVGAVSNPWGLPQPTGLYRYRLHIYVPNCAIIPARTFIAGRFAADNTGRLMLDGQLIVASQGQPNQGFLQANVTGFMRNLTPGLHVLEMQVTNIDFITGMVLNGVVTTICPATLELPVTLGPSQPRVEPTLVPETPQ